VTDSENPSSIPSEKSKLPHPQESKNQPAIPSSQQPAKPETEPRSPSSSSASTPAVSEQEAVFTYHCRRGEVLYRQGVWEQALLEFRRAADARPEDPDIYLRIGQAYERKGSSENERAFQLLAMENFRKAISMQPSNAPAHDGLIALGVKMGILDELVADYKEKSLQDPQNHIISEGLKKLQAISFMSIPEGRGAQKEKGFMARFLLDIAFPFVTSALFLGGILVHQFFPNFRLHAVAKPLAFIGGFLLLIFLFYKFLSFRGVNKRSQW